MSNVTPFPGLPDDREGRELEEAFGLPVMDKYVVRVLTQPDQFGCHLMAVAEGTGWGLYIDCGTGGAGTRKLAVFQDEGAVNLLEHYFATRNKAGGNWLF